MGLARYIRIGARQAQLCLARDMQYRAHFVGRTVSWLLWTGTYLAFIQIILSRVGSIAGWGGPQMYVLYGTYMLMDGIAQVCIQPNMHQMSSYVAQGALDLVLTRPADSQFMVSTARWDFMGLGSVLVGGVVVAVALSHAGVVGCGAVLGYLACLVSATAILYALWFASSLLVFWTQRLDGVGFLFVPFFQLCRYPIAAYPPVLQGLFRTALPMAFVVTVPAQVLLGLGGWHQLMWCAAAAFGALGVSRLLWAVALSRYASVSS